MEIIGDTNKSSDGNESCLEWFKKEWEKNWSTDNSSKE